MRNSLQFNDHNILHQQISEIFTHHLFMKINLNPVLLLHLYPHFSQSQGKRIFIHSFQKTMPQLWINDFIKGMKNPFSNLLMLHARYWFYKTSVSIHVHPRPLLPLPTPKNIRVHPRLSVSPTPSS